MKSRLQPARHVAAVLLILASASLSQVAVAEEKTFRVGAQDAAASLMEFGRQAGLQIIFGYERIKGIKTNAVDGIYEPLAAIQVMLKGTGLSVSEQEDGIFVVEPNDAPGSRRPVADSDASMQIVTQLVQADSQTESMQKVASTEERKAQTDRAIEQDEKSGQQAISEIIVTAQKREQRLQDVPMSVSVLSGADLDRSTAEGITGALDRVPGVVALMSSQGGNAQLAVRGVASGSALFQGSSTIAYYMDSVPFGLVRTALVPDMSAYDLERVEVLRGPQGTLYGASALNGVVRVLTKDADLNDFEFKARTSVSSTEQGGGNYRGDVAVNVPLIEGKLAARAVVGYQNSSGWIDQPTEKDGNDTEIQNYRLKINAQPTEELSVRLSAWRQRRLVGAPSISADGKFNSHLFDSPVSDDFDAYGLKIGYEFPSVSVASMTSYIDYKNFGTLDFGAPLETYLPAKVFSQEILLNSKLDSPWRWSAGVFYRDAKDVSFQTFYIPGFYDYPLDQGDASKSSAVFGEIGRRFMQDRLEWAVGLRYFQDDVTIREAAILTEVLPEPFIDKDSYHATTPRAVLTWHASDDLTVYGSYSQGFRSGFHQDLLVLVAQPNFPSVKPDKLTNYEVGMKGSRWNRRITFETSLYYIDWQDVMQNLAVDFGGPEPISAPINGNSASGFGLDAAVTTLLLDGLEMGLNFSWNDLTEDSQVFSGGSLVFDKGDRLGNSPEYTAGAWVDYAFPLGAPGLKGRVSASANYQAGLETVNYSNPDAPDRNIGDPQVVCGASFAVEALDHWTASLFVDNVTNEQGTRKPFPSSDLSYTQRMRPRTLGLQLEYRFGK